jgi:hypothetical protein
MTKDTIFVGAGVHTAVSCSSRKTKKATSTCFNKEFFSRTAKYASFTCKFKGPHVAIPEC